LRGYEPTAVPSGAAVWVIADGFNLVDESKKSLILEPNREIDLAIRCFKMKTLKIQNQKIKPPPPLIAPVYRGSVD